MTSKNRNLCKLILTLLVVVLTMSVMTVVAFAAQTNDDTSTTNVAEVNGVKYDNLQAAINAAGAGETVVLLADVALEKTIYLPAEKTLTIDGNGYKLTPAAGFAANMDAHGAVIVLANGDRGYSANSNYTIKNLTIDGFTVTRVIRANFANVVIDNCKFYNNTVKGGVITSAEAEITVDGCIFDGNTVKGDAAYGVIEIGADVGNGTTVIANITNNTFCC